MLLHNFSIFERDLIGDLQEKKGFPQVLWNSPSDPDAAKYLHMIQYVEKDTAKILEESEMNAKEELEEETETVSTIAYAKISYTRVANSWSQSSMAINSEISVPRKSNNGKRLTT